LPCEIPGFIPDKSNDHSKGHKPHDVVGIVCFEGKGGKKKSDGEKEETLGGGLPCEDEKKDEKGGKEGETKEELETDGAGLTKSNR
jgi:hypothetical protein